VNRWQALVEIVKSFNERGSTILAFAAVCAFVVLPLAIYCAIALALGWPNIPAGWLPGG
jgi:hypothetical protein